MSKITLYQTTDIEETGVEELTIAVRTAEKWVFVRKNEQPLWGLLCEKRNQGETLQQALVRIIRAYFPVKEEEFEAEKVCVYEVTHTEQGKKSTGMLFWVNIPKLSWKDLEDRCLADTLPEALSEADKDTQLFDRIQGWLNLRSGAGELWDVYDVRRNRTGRFHHRGDVLAEGDYHMVVHVWIQNSKGEFLITKRSPNKGFANMWECTGGSALAGDDSITAAMREVFEETGIVLSKERGKIVLSGTGSDYFWDVWLFREEFDLSKVVLLEGETCDAMAASAEDILQMYHDRTFVPYDYLKTFFCLCKE